MKKALSIFLIFALLLPLAACNDQPQNTMETEVIYDGFINDEALQKAFEEAITMENGDNFRAYVNLG